jgi:sec-independent protein translocase protein TatA
MELLSPTHLLLIFLVALLLFGPKKLPELGKGIGEGFRALKEGMKEKPAEPAASTNATAAPSQLSAPGTTTDVKS